jgi:Fur family ferric uptake transcriptional regulator
MAEKTNISKDQFLRQQMLKVLEEQGQELLPEDLLVADAFLGATEHVSLEELRRRICADHEDIDISFVRRTMRMLCEFGIAQQVSLDDRVVYEHLHLQQHHDHMICVRCGKICEFENPAVEDGQLQSCHKLGFRPLMHHLEIRGLCADCVAKRPVTRPLGRCFAGETVEVVQMLGGGGLCHRLMSMGLLRGSRIRVLTANGPMTIEVRGSRVALGRKQAMHIMVKSVDEHSGSTEPDSDKE